MWWCRPIKRDEPINDVLAPVYNSLKEPCRGKTSYHSTVDANRRPRLLAALHMVLVVGALVHLNVTYCSTEPERYYWPGRAGLSNI